MSDNVIPLYHTNHRDPVGALRQIAQDIEDGRYGGVGCISLALLGDTMEVFGIGPNSDGPSVAMLLYSGFLRIARAVEEHGQEME